MSTTSPSLSRVLVIAGFSLSCFGLLLYFWLAFGGPIPLKPQGYRVKVAFTDASTLAQLADVRTAGVTIGKVVKKELAPGGGRTLTTIELEDRYAPLRSDARAILRQKTLLGETYVELTTGSRQAPLLKEGARLDNGRVAQAVEFDELLQVFDKPTRTAFREWQASLAQAGAGRGRDLSDALGNLPTFTENAQSVVDVLDTRRSALRNLVHNAGRTFEDITRDEGALTTLVQSNSELFGELAERREALADSIRILPTFLDESRLTLARLRTFSENTDPLLVDLDPVLDDLQPTVASLGDLAPDLENLFDNIDPLIDAGDEGLPALSRTLRGLDPTLESTGPFLRQVNPLLRFMELNQAKLADFFTTPGAALGGIRATGPGSKSNGHVLPQVVVLGEQSLPALSRTPDNRGNAYPEPSSRPEGDILPSFDCRNGGEKGPTSTPACRVQGPIGFGNRSQSYPQVREAGPGGVLP
ncbi:MAG: MCE family protein [Solirubrobacterales bacterium]|nr:MCE family protein [Solirubrobacterales bacterium]